MFSIQGSRIAGDLALCFAFLHLPDASIVLIQRRVLPVADYNAGRLVQNGQGSTGGLLLHSGTRLYGSKPSQRFAPPGRRPSDCILYVMHHHADLKHSFSWVCK